MKTRVCLKYSVNGCRMVVPKSEKNKLTFDCDYIDNMRLNFDNEEMINFFYHFGLKVRRLKTEHTSLQHCQETFSRKGHVAT